MYDRILDIINERKRNDEESRFFEVLQRVPRERWRRILAPASSEPKPGAMAGRSEGMLRGMDGEGLKMASEQRTDYRAVVFVAGEEDFRPA